MFRETNRYTVPLTPAFASQVATMRAWKGERPERENLKSLLARKLADGQFHSCEWAFANLNGVKYRVDGQHSSRALAECNGEFPAGLQVFVKEFDCDTEHDLAALFAQFNAPLSSRNACEVANAHARIHDELVGIAPGKLRDILAGIVYAYKIEGTTIGRVGAEARAQLIHENIPFIVFAAPYAHDRGIRRAPVMGAVFATWNKSHGNAREFWDLVQGESHPDPLNPSRVLSAFLRSAAQKTIQFAPPAYYAKSIHAWNAWRRKQKTDLKYYPKSDVPSPI